MLRAAVGSQHFIPDRGDHHADVHLHRHFREQKYIFAQSVRLQLCHGWNFRLHPRPHREKGHLK